MLVISVQSDGGCGCVGGGCGCSSLALCNEHNTLSVYKVMVGVGMGGEGVGALHLLCVIHTQLYWLSVYKVMVGVGRVGEGVGTLHLLCVIHTQLYWLSVYKVMVGVGMVEEGVGTLHLLCVMHITAGYTGYQCTKLLWVWVGVDGGGSVLHLLSVMHVIARLVINVQGDYVRVCFRPSIGQDWFPSAFVQ